MSRSVLRGVFFLSSFLIVNAAGAVEMNADGHTFLENVRKKFNTMDYDSNYRKEETIINEPNFYYEGETYEYIGDQLDDRRFKLGLYMDLKKNNPALYYYLQIFAPPVLNHIAFFILTLLIAVGGLFAFGSSGVGCSGLLLRVLCIYAWGRIIAIFITASLIGQGVISP